MNKIQQFLEKNKAPKIFIYQYGIPTGVARTKGHGNPGYISVILANENFKTRNSPHVELWSSPLLRRDYGGKKGNYAKYKEQAKIELENWQQELGYI